MQLESVKALKHELLHEVVIPISRATHPLRASSRSTNISEETRELLGETRFAIAARTCDAVPEVQRSVALGIVPYKGEFRLAIRVQRQALLHGPLVGYIVERARNEVDIRLIGRVEKRPVGAGAPWHQRNARPLLIGTSVGHVNITAGTIGAFVKRADRSYILSNNHVLADEDKGNEGDPILQRGRFDGGRDPHDRVATLRHWIRLKKRGPNFVDAALAEMDDGVDWDPTLLQAVVKGTNKNIAGIGPEYLNEGDIVYKVGRTTGATRGKITAFDFDELVVNYDAGNLRFDGQIEIEGIGSQAFSDGGDSGSLIVNSGMQVVALLFAGSDLGGSNRQGLTYAHPIRQVLKELKADLLT